MANFLGKIDNIDNYLSQIDKAIKAHNLADVLKNHRNTGIIKPSAVNRNIGKTKISLSDADKRKQQMLKELEEELLFLGLKEGKGMETRDIGGKSDDVDYRGVLSKKIKSDLIMEYTFSSQTQQINNFSLNNVGLELASIPEDKLLKLYIIAKFLNSAYRDKKNDKKEDALNLQEMERLKKEEEAKKRRQMVLDQL